MDQVTYEAYRHLFESYLKRFPIPIYTVPDHPQRYIYVIAESYAAFRAYCMDEGFGEAKPSLKNYNVQQAIYLHDTQMLRGYSNVDIILYGRYQLADSRLLEGASYLAAIGRCRLFLGRNRRDERIAELEKRKMTTRVKLINRHGMQVAIVDVSLTENQVTDLRVLVNEGFYYLNEDLRERASGMHVFRAINRDTGIHHVVKPEPTDIGELDLCQAEKIKKQIEGLNLELDDAKKRGLAVRVDTNPFNRVEASWIRREY